MKQIFSYAVIVSALLFSFAHTAAAQDSGTGDTTETGAIVETEPDASPSLSLEAIQQQAIQAAWEARRTRSDSFKSELEEKRELLQAYRNSNRTFRDDMLAYRQEAHADLRKSSKFTKLPNALKHFREILSRDLTRLEDLRIYVEEMPGITDDIRWLTITRIDLLMDAESVVINAIDYDAYEAYSELLTAKESLQDNYREPLTLMMTRLRSDRTLTWIASLMVRIGDLAEDIELPAESETAAYNALVCLTEVEEKFEGVVNATELITARDEALLARMNLTDCLGMLRDAYVTYQASLEPEVVEEPVEEEVNPYQGYNRRIQRLLRNTDLNIYDDKAEVDTFESDEESMVPVIKSEPIAKLDDPFFGLNRRLRSRLTGTNYRIQGQS